MARLLDRVMGKRADIAERKIVHRGRVWRDHDYWRYVCLDCDFGAGSRIAPGLVRSVTWPWLMRSANEHANPEHWSRRRGY